MGRLHRILHDNGVVTLQSAQLRQLGLVHGFSTRLGGVSAGPYASLNLSTLAKDERSDFNTAVAENFRRLRRALGCERLARVEVRQVHGGRVWVPPAEPVRPAAAPEADAMVTDRWGKLLTVRVADCVPVLLAGMAEAAATGEGAMRGVRAVAAVHAGWRGVVAEVVPAAVAAMERQFGVRPAALVAAIGPHIGVARFEVGLEVAAAFEAGGLDEAVHRNLGSRPHVDLGHAVRMQLQHSGVPAEHIDMDTQTYCTHRDAELFYSYRRDGARSGRMAAVIAIA